LREELIAAQDAYRLQDILGGVGYIFGVAGLALWWRARRFGSRRGVVDKTLLGS
jgi:nickel transport protein